MYGTRPNTPKDPNLMGQWMRNLDDVIVVILGGGRGTRLDPLTRLRSKPAVPVAGKYRLIDLPISNCLHSGMERMLLLTQFNSISLHRHITRTFKFDPFSRGFVQILAAQQTPEGAQWFQGTADAVRQNLHIIKEMVGDKVLILAGDHMYRADYRDMLWDHLESKADITVAVNPCTQEEVSDFGAVRVDEVGQIVEFREKPRDAEARDGMEISDELREQQDIDATRPYMASMGIYLFNKDVLVEYLEQALMDFGSDIIPVAAAERKVQAHFFKGYWKDIGTIKAFYDAHMDLVSPNPPFHFNDPEWPFYTWPQYLPGARLDDSRFRRSILCEGTRVIESVVEHSIIGLRTSVRGATVRRSLVMGVDPNPPDAPEGYDLPEGTPPLGIGEGSVIEGAIVDKNARIGRNVSITNRDRIQEADGEGWVIREGIPIVTKNALIPDDFKI